MTDASGAPVDPAAAENMSRGWLAEHHLASRLPAGIRSVDSYPHFHVVQLQPEGFIVTASDDRVEPVIAFSAHGRFDADPESPLWILLNRDLPSRSARAAHVAPPKSGRPGTKKLRQGFGDPDAEWFAAETNQARWKQLETRGTRHARNAALAAGIAPLAAGSDTDTLPPGNPPPAPVTILDFQLVDGHARLTHDAPGSVTIYASHDNGVTWQVQDSGVVWSTWVSKQPTLETACYYRVEPDQLVDEVTVGLMRNPPPGGPMPDEMAASDAEASAAPSASYTSVGSVSDVRVAPLVQSHWDQSSAQGNYCYNYYTPGHYYSGCVATALAQLMRYWQYPSSGIGRVTKTVYVNGSPQSATTVGGDGAGGAYNWSAMPLSPASTGYNATQWQMIGALCYDAGIGVNMMYSPSGSGAYMYLCASALKSVFQFASACYINYPQSLLQPINSSLAAGCPVLLGISASGTSGHAIVCDGFGYDSGVLYHHLNLGWSGYYDCWYTLPGIGTPYNFNSIDTVIFNVFPSGTGELISGRVVTPLGVPVPGATITASRSGSSYSATTDSKGYYGLKVPSSQSYSVTASKAGMATGTRTGVAVGASAANVCGNLTGIDFTLSSTFSFSATALASNICLRWTAPTNSGMPTNTVYIRWRTDRYPLTSSDGTEVYSGPAQTFTHAVDNTGSVTNYYTIWGDNGSAYASLGSSVNASGCADRGKVRLLFVGQGGEVSAWNLSAAGKVKSSGYVSANRLGPSGYWTAAGFADIDRDGVSDILWTGGGGEVSFWLLNADGTARTNGRVTQTLLGPAGYWTAAGFADIDRDGTADILWSGAGGEVSFWLLNPDGSLKSKGRVTTSLLSPAGYWTARGFRDIDGDGTADILWTGAGGETSLWFLNTDGSIKSKGRVTQNLLLPAGYWTASGLADIDGDGTPDIIWLGAGGEVSRWFLNANGTVRATGRVTPTNLAAGYWSLKSFSDVDGDGTADMVWLGSGGELSCWLLKPDGTIKSSGRVVPTALSPAGYWNIPLAGRTGR
ncbi:MAG: C10 family peptidase [Verrucomicrobiota bacterium]